MASFLELTFAEKKHSTTETGKSVISPRRFHIHETMSGLFEVGVVARSHDHAVDFDKVVGKAAGLKLHTGYDGATAPTRLWTGVCSHLEQLQVEVSDQGESTYFLRIVPELWLLGQRVNYRVFQRLTLPEIVQAVLKDWKIRPKLVLVESYLKHDYVVQYGETDHDFICRILERAGITYYFDFPAGKNVELVLSDRPHLREERSGAGIPWVDHPSRAAEKEFCTRVHVAQGVRPGKLTVREFDPRQKPDFRYFGNAPEAAAPEKVYDQYHYLPGDSLRVAPPDGDKLATPVADDKGKVRTSQLELDARAKRALLSARRTRNEVVFQSNCVDLAPGTAFHMERHPRSDLQKGAKLLVIEYTLEGAEGDVWTFAGKAVYARTAYQPELKTPRPRIAGVQSAIVVGPKGKEIYTDEFGRVRVQLHWDRSGKYDDESSCWVRVSQPWAGSGYGFQLLPRVGHEVLVGHLEGDPDQPVVVGRVYNKINRVPHKLPDHKTRSTWKSDTSPHQGGFNEIMYEDKKGEELFYVQAELDLQKLTKREEVERVFADRAVVVGKDLSAVIKTVDATLVGDTYTQQIIKPPSEYDLKILKQETPTVTPTNTTMEMIKKRVIFTTGKATVAFDDDSIVFEASGDIKIKAAGGDAIFEGSHAYLNSKTPATAPKPKAVEKGKPGTFVSSAADKRDVLTRFQAKRAELAYQKLSPRDKKRFDHLLVQAKSDQERMFLKKALAAGHDVKDIDAFAGKIRGKDQEWMQNNLFLTGSSSGTGVQQQFSTSCNATTVQALHGELDPVYALKLHEANPNFAGVNPNNATAMNPNLAAEQKALLQTPYAGAVPGLAGLPGVAVARNAPGGAGRFSDDQFNALSGTTGLRYQTQLLNPANPGTTLPAAMSTIDKSLEAGAPVPLIIGQNNADPAHYVMVTGSSDGPPKSYTIHDPWDGATVTRTADQMQNGRLGIAGHNFISGLEKPTVLP